MSNRPALSDRAQYLLKVLVERYIEEGQPVGSRALARAVGFNLSPATIRNVMADLEDLGLVVSPHTSAGRVPTVSGYRFFIDSLLTVKPLQQNLINQLEQDLGSYESADQLLETASKLLSEITHLAGLVTLPRRATTAFRHIEFLPISQDRVLVILVTNEHEVHNKIIRPARRFSAAELQTAANYLNAVYVNKGLTSIRESLLRELQETRDQMNQEAINAAEMAELAFREKNEDSKGFILAGETNLMDFSELANMERLRALFDALHQKQDILYLLDRCLETSGIRIFIGEESGYQVFDQCSLVTTSYSINNRMAGVLGVIGPTRMAYERIIPVVDLTAKLLGAALNHRSSSPS